MTQTQQNSLETSQVETFLLKHLGQEVSKVLPIDQGEWSQAFSFQHAAKDYVIRFGQFGEDFRKDQLASTFATTNLVIPKITEIGQAFDRYFAISARAFGDMLEGLNEAKMVAIVPAVFSMLDAIRETDISSTTGYGNWNIRTVAPYQNWQSFLLDF